MVDLEILESAIGDTMMSDLLQGAFGRNALIEYLSNLANREYQEQVWINRMMPQGVEYDDISEVIHFLYDDTRIAAEPNEMVGVYFRDSRELEAMKTLIMQLDVALENIDIIHTPVREFIDNENWTNVIHAAQNALAVFNSP